MGTEQIKDAWHLDDVQLKVTYTERKHKVTKTDYIQPLIAEMLALPDPQGRYLWEAIFNTLAENRGLTVTASCKNAMHLDPEISKEGLINMVDAILQGVEKGISLISIDAALALEAKKEALLREYIEVASKADAEGEANRVDLY